MCYTVLAHYVKAVHTFYSHSFVLVFRFCQGEKSISDSVISFHYTESTMMHVIDFMLYHIRPYGVYAWYEKEQIKNEPNRPFDKESY